MVELIIREQVGVAAAEGKTKKTRAAIRRVDVGRIEDGAVGVGRGLRCT